MNYFTVYFYNNDIANWPHARKNVIMILIKIINLYENKKNLNNFRTSIELQFIVSIFILFFAHI